MKANEKHLTQDQLFIALVDDNDLDLSLRDHATTCSDCHLKIQQLKQQLNNLGNLARETAPKPCKELLPLINPGKINPLIKPVFAAALATLLLVLVFTVPWNRNEIDHFNTAEIIQEMEMDEQFMADIEELESIALSGLYMDSNGEGYGFIDDEFIDFLIPSENGSII